MLYKKINLIILILTVTLAILYKYYFNEPQRNLHFHGRSRLSEIKEVTLSYGDNFIIKEDQKIKRGDGRFTLVLIENMDTDCGHINVKLSFFNEELSRIEYRDISKEKIESSSCMKKILSGKEIHGDNLLKQIIYNEDKIHYDIIFRDTSIEDKINEWIGKWS